MAAPILGKSCAFFSLQKKLVVKEHNSFYLGLVTPSSGVYSLILTLVKTCLKMVGP